MSKSDRNFEPTFADHHLLPDMSFNGLCLWKSNISILKKVINLYIFYTLGPQLRNLNTDFMSGNCLKLIKNADLDKYKYIGYGIGFNSRSQSSFTDESYGKNVIIFGADMSSSVHVDNKWKDILILGEGPTQGLDDTTLTAEAKYPIKNPGKSLHYNRSKSFLFFNATKVYQFKAKNSEIKDYALCLGNVSKDLIINNMKKAGIKEVAKCFLLF